MRISPTLSLYLGKRFLSGVLLIFGVLIVLAGLIDFIELFRRAAGRDDVTFAIILQMSLLKLPNLTLKLFPFIALFGAMLTFTRLTRSSELSVIRASGVSVWQFLMPSLLIALLVGIFVVTVYNPLSSAFVSRFEQMEARYLSHKPSFLKLSDRGMWLRQADEDGQSVIHALNASSQGVELEKVIIFLYEGSDRFKGRIDAGNAYLRNGYWELNDVLLTSPDAPAEFHDTYKLKTTLTPTQIQESFASPETMSFWDLPGFITTLEESGLSATKHRLHWHSLMSLPLLLLAMVLFAATFSLRLTRRGGTGLLLAGGVLAGFVLYFITDVVFAFGRSGAIPVILAAWTPAGVSTLLGLSMMFHLEDG